MAAPAERKAYFIRSEHQDLHQYFREKCRPLLGSEVRYDNEGNIFYATWHDLSKKGLLAPEFISVSRVHPQADIYAPFTRYSKVELRINQVSEDEGSVETAIRSMDHILEGTRTKERTQAGTVQQRAGKLLDLFSMSFAQITEEEFRQKQQETYALLAKVCLDPNTVITEEKQRMSQWLIKGSFGKDRLGRRNRLISTMALTAAKRRAVERQRGLSYIEVKFVQGREALILEREFSRAIFEDVSDWLRPETLPAHEAFKFPDRSSSNIGIVKGLLGTMRFQLQQLHIKTYRTVGCQAETILAEIIALLKQDKREEIIARDLFNQARTLLTEELEKHKDIYPLEQA